MSDLIFTKSKEPFETEQAAKMRQGVLKKEGTMTEVVEVEGGFALKSVAVRKKKKGTLGRRNVLTVDDKDPNFVYRWVKDDPKKPGRVKQLEDVDYEIVRVKHEVGDERVEGVSLPGSGTRIPFSGGTTGVLMRIKKEWYAENQNEKQEAMDAVERRMVEDREKDGLVPANRL